MVQFDSLMCNNYSIQYSRQCTTIITWQLLTEYIWTDLNYGHPSVGKLSEWNTVKLMWCFTHKSTIVKRWNQTRFFSQHITSNHRSDNTRILSTVYRDNNHDSMLIMECILVVTVVSRLQVSVYFYIVKTLQFSKATSISSNSVVCCRRYWLRVTP